MNKILKTKLIIAIFCVILVFSATIFGSNKAIDENNNLDNIKNEIEDETENNTEDDTDLDIDDEDLDDSIYDYGSNETVLRQQSYLLDSSIPLEERLYSDKNIPLKNIEDISSRVIMSAILESQYNFDDIVKLYEGMGYKKTASFVKELAKNIPTTEPTNLPNIKSNECYIHNNKYETRTILEFQQGELVTINIAYNEAIAYLYFSENISFSPGSITFDNHKADINVLDDYCVTKGENISQYADMDEFIRNFVLVIIVIFVLILIVSRLNKTNKTISSKKSETNDTKNTKNTTNDNELVAILTAVIAAYEHKSIDGIRIKTIRKNIRWKNI